MNRIIRFSLLYARSDRIYVLIPNIVNMAIVLSRPLALEPFGYFLPTLSFRRLDNREAKLYCWIQRFQGGRITTVGLHRRSSMECLEAQRVLECLKTQKTLSRTEHRPMVEDLSVYFSFSKVCPPGSTPAQNTHSHDRLLLAPGSRLSSRIAEQFRVCLAAEHRSTNSKSGHGRRLNGTAWVDSGTKTRRGRQQGR